MSFCGIFLKLFFSSAFINFEQQLSISDFASDLGIVQYKLLQNFPRHTETMLEFYKEDSRFIEKITIESFRIQEPQFLLDFNQ